VAAGLETPQQRGDVVGDVEIQIDALPHVRIAPLQLHGQTQFAVRKIIHIRLQYIVLIVGQSLVDQVQRNVAGVWPRWRVVPYAATRRLDRDAAICHRESAVVEGDRDAAAEQAGGIDTVVGCQGQD